MRLANRICETGSTGVFETNDVAPQQIKDQPRVEHVADEAEALEISHSMWLQAGLTNLGMFFSQSHQSRLSLTIKVRVRH